MRFKFIAFDLDGVIVDDRSSWEWVHHYFGVSNKASYDAFIEGRIDDAGFIREDIALWKGADPDIDLARVGNILKAAKLMKGAEETMLKLKDAGAKIGIVSGGIDLLANHVADILDIEHVAANGLEADEHGRLTGEGIINVPLWDKGTPLLDMLAKVNVDPEDCAVIGNSCIDVSMFEKAGFSIAFRPIDDMTCDSADVVVDSSDLRDILPHLFD